MNPHTQKYDARKSLLVVCAGNTCRSPMAAALLQSALPELDISSAGLTATRDQHASDGAKRAMTPRGHDLDPHRATGLTDELVKRADLVACMEQSQADAILRRVPSANVKTLGTWAGIPGDVADPHGGNDDVYGACAEHLTTLVAAIRDADEKRRRANGHPASPGASQPEAGSSRSLDEWASGQFGKGALVRDDHGDERLVLWRTDEHGAPFHYEGCQLAGVAYESVIAHLLVQPSGLCRSYEQDPARPAADRAAQLDSRLRAEPPPPWAGHVFGGEDLDGLDDIFDDA